MTISNDIESLIKEILDDRTHGASQLARQALDVLRVAAVTSQSRNTEQFKKELEEIGWRLMSVRPSMAPIYNAVKRLLAAVDDNTSSDVGALRQATIAQTDAVIQDSIAALTEIGGYTAEVVADKDVILTHTYSSTVALALKVAHKRHHIKVIVTRSGAGRTGQRTAWELNYAGIPVTFIDDTAIGLFVSQANKVIVGADRICSDGGLVNGIGTYLMALAAAKAGVPLYVACETLKFDSRLKSTDVELEEKDTNEIAPPGILPEGVVLRNPYFEITPLELITGIITEDGLVKQSEVLNYITKLTAQLG